MTNTLKRINPNLIKCKVSQRLLAELAEPSAIWSAAPNVGARKECDAIRRKLVEHAKLHDCVRL
jgi:hypothetical protein